MEKGLTSTKANTKSYSLEAILLYIELDIAAPIIEDLLPPLSNKQPKVVAATLGALTAIYHNYGCKIVDPKPALKALPKAFGHADKNVRAEATNLALEFYRWLREAMKPIFWGDLKPTQQADIEGHFEKIKLEPAPKQERYLRSQQAAMIRAPVNETCPEENGDDFEEPEEIDVFSMLEPQDVLSKIAPNFNDKVSSTKWKDRKEALESVYTVINVPKIKDGDYSELVRIFSKCMKDPNITVVMQAAQCVEVLAKGLRKAFAKYRSTIFVPMIERLKEKKASVSDAIGAALDQVFLATNLIDNLEEILENLKHKNPQVKEGTMKFLTRCLKTTREAPSKQEVSSIAEAAKKLMAESSEILRSGGAEVLGTVMKIMGERCMAPYLESIDDIRKTKIKEYFDAAEVKAKDKPKPIQPTPVNRAAHAPASRKPHSKKPVMKKPSAAPTSLPSQELTATLQSTVRISTNSKVSGIKGSNLVTPSIKPPNKRAVVGPSGAVSPHRANTQASVHEEEVAPAPRISLSRGLAGRSLAAKAPANFSLISNSSPPLDSGLSVSEKTELEELRKDNDKLSKLNEELRQERSRLNSEIQELKNETAKLIEDRAKDSLIIIAKETQLVRARADHEAAESMCGQLRREMERLKRALSTVERVSSPTAMSPTREGAHDDFIFHRDAMTHSNLPENRQTSNRSRLSHTSTIGDDKEDSDFQSNFYRNKITPDLGRNGRTSAASGRNSPATLSSYQPSRYAKNTSVDGIRAEVGQGLESWRRAAEVTSALREKIEQMKVRNRALNTVRSSDHTLGTAGYLENLKMAA